MTSWSFRYDEYDPRTEGLRETLTTLGNGYFATRGAAQESVADAVHYPGTYLAGGYDRQTTEIAGHEIENEDLVNLPNWLPLTFRAEGGRWFGLQGIEVLDYRQTLDMENGLLERYVRFRDKERTTELRDRRLVSLAEPHLAATETWLRPEDWEGPVEVRSGIDGRVVNAGVARYAALTRSHLDMVAGFATPDGLLHLKVRTRQSDLRVAMTTRTTARRDDGALDVARTVEREDGSVAERFAVDIAPDRPLRIEKVVALYTSRDAATSEAGHQSILAARRAPGFTTMIEDQRRAYTPQWRRYGIHLHAPRGTPHETMRTLRLHLFHLMQTVTRHTADLDVGVPARGWHGEGYRGHIFWDELFILPILDLFAPDVSRALLKYRVRRLGEARAAAQGIALSGAMYPWQSGSDGREESQALHLNPRSGEWIPDNTHLQRHVGSAIAYNIWRYFQFTRDDGFLSYHGAEAFLEIARFWASKVEDDPTLDRYVIRGVVGPDEYHDAYPGATKPGIDNNAYTNILAAWVLQRVPVLLEALPQERARELCRRLRLHDDTLDHWGDIAQRLYVPLHDGGIISQFQGYHDLEPFDWTHYRAKYEDIHRIDRILGAEGDTANRYQVSKQPDVTMLFYLFSMDELQDILGALGHTIDEGQVLQNIDHYLERSAHGSTLSNVVESWVLARYDSKRSWALFHEALRSDVQDVQGGTTNEGIHLGAMAGTIDIPLRAYSGLHMREDRLCFDPRLPKELDVIRLPLHFRGHDLVVDVAQDEVSVRAHRSPARTMTVEVRGDIQEISPGETRTFAVRR